MGETFQTGGRGWVGGDDCSHRTRHTHPLSLRTARPRRERPGTRGSSLEITADIEHPTALKSDQATCRAKCSPWGYRQDTRFGKGGLLLKAAVTIIKILRTGNT